MKVVIFGSRSYANKKLRPAMYGQDWDRAFVILNRLNKSLKFDLVVTGGAPGADMLGWWWADINGVKWITKPADWDKYGKSAGMIRNKEMEPMVDMGVAFWDGSSPGTKMMIDIMTKADKDVLVEYFHPECKIVNLRSGEPYDVYIGRGPCPRTKERGRWGNPFRIGDYYNGILLDRDTCLDVYKDWLFNSNKGTELQTHLPELIGKTLGCWCKPEKCHGDILTELVNALP